MLLMSFGILLGSLFFGPIVDRYGYKKLLIISALMIFIGIEGIAFAPRFNLLQYIMCIIGISGGIINGGTNALVADISDDRKSANLSILGMFFGVGAIGVPLVLGNLLNTYSYEPIIAGIGFFVLLLVLFFIPLRFPRPKHEQGFPIKEGVGLLRETTLIIFGVILFFQSGIEITVGSWTAVYFHEELMVDASKAVRYFSFYWLGMVLARFLLGYLLNIISSVILQFSSIAIAFIGSLILITTESFSLSIVGLFLVGLGFAGCFPIILGYVGERYAKLSGTAFSITFVMALIGGMTFPYFTGILGQSVGLRSSFLLIPLSLCCITVLFSVVIKKLKN